MSNIHFGILDTRDNKFLPFIDSENPYVGVMYFNYASPQKIAYSVVARDWLEVVDKAVVRFFEEHNDLEKRIGLVKLEDVLKAVAGGMSKYLESKHD